jgi:hypothetical protein
MFPFAPLAIRRLNLAGAPVVVVSNQSGVARGYFLELLLHDVHDQTKRELAQAGAHLAGVYYFGAKVIFVKTGYGLGDFTWHAQTWPRQPDLITENLETAVDWILRDK